MTCVFSSVERALSVSSIRSRNFPPSRRAKSQLNSAVLAPPTCRYPVGDGAKRTLIVTENGGGGIRTPDRVLKPYNGLANRRLQPLGHPSRGVNYPRARLREQDRYRVITSITPAAWLTPYFMVASGPRRIRISTTSCAGISCK